MEKRNYALLLAPTGDWTVIDTVYGVGLVDSHTESGSGFSTLIAPATFVDNYLHIDNLTEQNYDEIREHYRTPEQKKRAILAFWGYTDQKRLFSSVNDFPRDTTEWEERLEYNLRNQSDS